MKTSKWTPSRMRNGVAIRFITKARLFIGNVSAVGHISDPPSRGVILSDAQLNLGTPFNPEDIENAKKSIQQIMRNNGLYTGTVGSATAIDPETHEVTIRFFVEAGKRARYEAPVIKGDPKLSDATIIKATGWRIPLIRRWRQVTEELTDKGTGAITKKYAKQGRLTAVVDVDALDYDGRTNRLKPTLNIDAGPKVTIKALEAKLSKSKLQALVPVYQEGAVDRDLLTEGATNIHDYFQAKGYPDVDVTFKSDMEQNDEELINYYIALGPRRRLVHIDILGSEYFSLTTLQERMFLQTNSILLKYGRYSETFRKQDEEAITNLYVANGFRDAKVTSSVQTGYKGKPRDLAVIFKINSGKQWTVGKLEIVGPSRLDLGPIRDQFYSIVGQPYADVNISSDRNRILQYYYDHGFVQANFRFRTQPGSAPETVDLTYYVREGPQEFIRKVLLIWPEPNQAFPGREENNDSGRRAGVDDQDQRNFAATYGSWHFCKREQRAAGSRAELTSTGICYTTSMRQRVIRSTSGRALKSDSLGTRRKC